LPFASSTSVYGASQGTPFIEEQVTGCAVLVYAATKESNELMAHAYGRVHGLRSTTFAERIVASQPLRLFAGGKLLRDCTYIDAVVEATVRLAGAVAIHPSAGTELFNSAPSMS